MDVDAAGLDACRRPFARAAETLGEGADHTEVIRLFEKS
jgi:hypothetical protein